MAGAVVEFDWAKAKPTELGFSYYENGNEFLSIGKPDWLPISVGVLRGHEGFGQPGILMLRTVIQDKLWIANDDARIISWLEGNQTCLSSFMKQCYESAPLPFEELQATRRHPRALSYQLHKVAEAYIMARQRLFPEIAKDVYWIGDPTGEDYWYDPSIAAARTAAEIAFTMTQKFVLSWFEVRGFRIDIENMLVHVPGYEPLLIMENQDM